MFVLWARVFVDFGGKILAWLSRLKSTFPEELLRKNVFLKDLQFLQTVFDFQQKLTECGETISAGLSKLKYLVDRNFWSSNFSLKSYINSKNSLRKWSSISWTGIIKLLPMCLYETLMKFFLESKTMPETISNFEQKIKKNLAKKVRLGCQKRFLRVWSGKLRCKIFWHFYKFIILLRLWTRVFQEA